MTAIPTRSVSLLPLVAVAIGCAASGEPSIAEAQRVVDGTVVAEAASPVGARLAETVVGPAVVAGPVGARPDDRRTLLDGLLAARARLFLSDTLPAAVASRAADLERPGAIGVFALAGAYRSEAAAEAAYDSYRNALVRQEFRFVYEPGLGDESSMYEGTAAEHGDLPRVIYVWRTGAMLLRVSADGSVKADARRIRAVADRMADHAVEPDGTPVWRG